VKKICFRKILPIINIFKLPGKVYFTNLHWF